jgi:hypothetical protein
MSLRDIYFAVSEMAVGDVEARNLDELKLQVKMDDCPVRLLLPATEGDLEFFGLGSLTRVTWRIRDLCLWQPVVAGTGIEQCADDILAYIELYSSAVRALRNPSAGSAVTGVTYKIVVVPWGTTDFWAIDIILTVEEYDP